MKKLPRIYQGDFNKEIHNNKEMEFQRYKPGSITKAMDILLDKK